MTDWNSLVKPGTPMIPTWNEALGRPIEAATIIGIDLGTSEKSVEYTIKDDKITEIRERIYNNTMPTHDPYSNPNALIYYECACGAILDPLTKSFASLNNAAMNAGWKIRFSDKGYIPHCVKCGEGVE